MSKRGHHKYKNGYMNGSATNGVGALLESPTQPVPKRPNPEDFLPIPKLRFSVAAAVVFIISVLCFCVSYDGDFVFDDNEAILGNNDLLPETPLSNLFINDFWGNKLDSKTSHKSYRPLTVLSFRFSYYLGGLSPPWFHIPNIVLHGIVSVLLLLVFSVLFGGYEVDSNTEKVQFKAAKSGLLCALLFAVHPIHTESVSGVVGRADLLCALLFLSSFLLYIKSCAQELHEDDNKLIIHRPSSFSVSYMLGSMLLCFLSVFCKEQGITVIGICSAYDIILVCASDPLQLLGLRKTEKSSVSNGHTNGNSKSITIEPWVLSLIKRHVFLLTTGLLLIMVRWRVMGSTPPTFMVFDNPHSFQNGTLIRGLNYNYLYSLNAWLLVNPWWLCFDWSMGCVPVIESYSDPRVIGSVAVWIIVGTLLFTCLKTSVTRDQRVLTMALALIIVPFLPASNVFFRVGFVIAERVLYLSSIGFCMLTVLGIRQMCAVYPKHAQVVQFALTFLICVFVLRCIQRSSQWRNEMGLFSAGEKVCPLNAKVHYNIAKLNGDNGNTDYAIEKYRLAIELNPNYDQAMNNLGNILKDRMELDEAERLLERALAIRTEFAAAWMNLGIVKASLKKSAEAERCYYTAMKHRRKYPDCLYNLGNLYLDLKMHNKAIEAWTNATILKPTHSNAWVNLAVVLDNLERWNESIEITKRALKHLPDDPQLYFNLGNVYGKQSNWEESEKYFLKAIKLKPTVAKFYANFGVLYHRWQKYEQAEQYYRKALSLNPNEANVRDNLAMLVQKMGKNAAT